MALSSSSPISARKMSISSIPLRDLAQLCPSAEFPVSQTPVLHASPPQAHKQSSSVLAARADLSLTSVPNSNELEQIPGRVLVPGVALHPSGALLYQPFLTGAPGSAGVKGGIDILDAHSGVLRLRIFLPQQFMTDVDGLHGSFLATDENGQRLFAITSSDGTPQHAALTIVQLAAVPLGIGTIVPSA